MSSVKTFFRHCPSCGRRFELRLVEKKLVDSRSMEEQSQSLRVSGGGFANVHTVVEQGAPVIVDVEDFQYSYKCKHCGHIWAEVREKTRETPESRR